MPSASMADAMVLAVYMPEQDPGPGIAVRSTNLQLLLGHRALRVAADRLEYRHDVALVGAGPNGAAIDEHRRAVEPRQRHQATRHVLIAAADGHDAVEALRADHRFDGVRDDLARHQANNACRACPSRCRRKR